MKPRHLFLLAMAVIATWAASRALRRAAGEAGAQARLSAGLWTVLAMTAQIQSTGINTAMTRSVKQRLDILVPQVFPNTGGTINGPVTTNGNHVINGTVTASGAATVHGFTSHGNIAADNTLSSGGDLQVGGYANGSGGGALENTGGIHVNSNNVVVDNDVSTSTMHVNGTRLNMVQFAGGWPIASGTVIVTPSTGVISPGFANALNNIRNACVNAGIMS
jgi:hypothetical protein